MRRALEGSDVIEVTASGEFTLSASKPTLFPGAVYGFAVHLDQTDLKAPFDEARTRKLSHVSRLKSVHPIEDTLYPLYWGKGIACVSLVVSDYGAAEKIMRRVYPDMLKTSMVRHGT